MNETKASEPVTAEMIRKVAQEWRDKPWSPIPMVVSRQAYEYYVELYETNEEKE